MDPVLFALLVLAIPIGILVGLGASVIGLTAWPLVVPLFFMFGGFTLHEALLSSMCIDLTHSTILAIYYQRKPNGGVDLRYSTKLGLVSGFIAVITAIIAFPILEQFSDLFKGGAGYITLILGVLFIIQSQKRKKQSMKTNETSHVSNSEIQTSKQWHQKLTGNQKGILVYFFTALQGFLTGLIAIGGAMNIALVLIILLGYPALRAGGTAMTTVAIMLSALVVVYFVLMEFVFTSWFVVSIYVIIGSISCIVGLVKAQKIDEWKLFLTIGIVVVTSAIFAMLQIYLLS